MFHNISINPVLNGFVCTVGCQTVVFASASELLFHLGEYLNDPKKKQKEFIANSCNAKHSKLEQVEEIRHDLARGCSVSVDEVNHQGPKQSYPI